MKNLLLIAIIIFSFILGYEVSGIQAYGYTYNMVKGSIDATNKR